MLRIVPLSWLVLLLITFTACGTSSPDPSPVQEMNRLGRIGLPKDGQQPWEQLDAAGHVIPARTASAAAGGFSSAGVDRFADSGATEVGEALHLSAPATGVAMATYRFALGGNGPGALAVDVNPAPGDSYYIGLGDYAADIWQWHGPYTDAQITLRLDSAANYISPLGNAFISVVVHDGASADVVNISVATSNPSDSTAPPAPAAPQLTEAQGGLQATWPPVVAADLAGYNLYFSYSPFTAVTENGVKSIGYLEGTTTTLLRTLKRVVWVAVGAVDTSGNEALSAVSTAFAGGGGSTLLDISVSKPSAQRDDLTTLTVGGDELYDIDLDGDGTFEVTGAAAGDFTLDTSAAGLLRPRVRALNADGVVSAMGGLSVFVAGGGRPVASARVEPAFGQAPLLVQFDGSASAAFEGTIAEYAWDVDGDGIYDTLSTDGTALHSHTYNTPGTFNAKLRVTDNAGKWDVDSLAITANLSAAVQLTVNPTAVQLGERIDLSAVATEAVTDWQWDLDGDGTSETSTGTTPTAHTSFNIPGPHTLTVRAQFATGSATAAQVVLVRGYSDTYSDAVSSPSAHSRLLNVGGNPAIFYSTSFGPGNLTYVRALDAAGTAWDSAVTVVSGYHYEFEVSPQVVAGRPAVAFFKDSDGSRLQYIRANDGKGTSWGAPIVVDNSDYSSNGCSLQVVNGRPAVAYHRSGGGLRYARSSDANGSAWPGFVTLSSDEAMGELLSMQVIAGQPAVVATTDVFGSKMVYYWKATDADGASWINPDFWYFPELPQSLALRVVNGRPAYVVGLSGTKEVWLHRALNADGTLWPHLLTSVVATDYSSNLAFNLVGGVPCVSYVNDQQDPYLRLVRAGDLNGSAWGAPQSLRLLWNPTPGSTDLLDVNGRPGVTSAESFSTPAQHHFGIVY
jgi:PKD repeat protein